MIQLLRRARPHLPAAAAVAFTIWVAWPFVDPDEYVTSFDFLAYSGPNLQVTFDALRAGDLAQWNDLIFGGVTHLGNPQTAALYPVLWPFAAIEVHRALLTVVAVHLAVLSAGVWFLLRRALGVSPVAALVGTATVVGSGAVMARSIQFEQLAVVAWVPWVLLAVDGVLAARRPRTAVALAALAAALLAVAGHPQQAFIAAPLVLAWAVGRVADRGAHRRVPALAAAAALALAVAAVALLPVAAQLGDAANVGGRDLAAASDPAYSLGWRHVTGTLFGDPAEEVHPVTSASFEAMAFVGIAAATLAALGLLAAHRDERRWTLVALLATGTGALVLALGPRTAVYRLLFDVVPGFDQARVPGRWMMVVVLVVAVLAAVGVDSVSRRRPTGAELAGAATLVGGPVAVALLGPVELPSGVAGAWWVTGAAAVLVAAARPRWTPAAVRATLAVAVPAALVVAELGWMSASSLARQSRFDDPVTELGGPIAATLADRPGRAVTLTDDRFGDPSYLVAMLRPNANVFDGVPLLDGYDGGVQVTDGWARALSALAPGPLDPNLPLRNQLAVPVDPVTAARFGWRWLVIETEGRDPASIAPGWVGPTVVDGSVEVWENPAWAGPARLVTRAEETPSDPSALPDRLRTLPGGTVLVDDPAALALDGAPAGEVDLTRRDQGAIDVRVAPAGPSLLVIDSQHDEGWSARVDGRPVDPVVVDGLLLGVPVDADDRLVELRYRAPGLAAGAAVSAAGLAVAGILVVTDRRRVARVRPVRSLLRRWRRPTATIGPSGPAPWPEVPASPWSATPPPSGVWCRICGWSGEEFVGPQHCEGAECPRCGSIARDRFLFHCFVSRHPAADDLRVLETSPRLDERYRSAMAGWFRYTSSDFDERAHRGAVRIDLQDIDLPDDAVDVVLTPHVLEHVPDTDRALAELRRVVAPGGRVYLQVPLLQGVTAPPTEPEFHGDDTPVFWRFGWDLADRARVHGFEVATLCTAELVRSASEGRGWSGPVSGEFDVADLLATAPTEDLVVVADDADAARQGFVPAYMFVTWELRLPG